MSAGNIWSFGKENIVYSSFKKGQYIDAPQGKFPNKLYLNVRYSDFITTHCGG